MNNSILNKVHKNSEEIVRFCHNYKKIYVYGAGVVSGFMLRYLKEENIEVEGIIVSNGLKKENENKWKKIFEVQEIVFSSLDGVILATDALKQGNIKRFLLSQGLKEEQIYCQRIFFANANPSIVYASLLTGKLADDVSNDGYFKECIDLNTIGLKHGTDKSSEFHNYLNKYEFFLKKWKNKKFNLLELGVFNGASLKMWEEYFQNAVIYGVDIDENCKQFENGRSHVLVYDLSDEDNLIKLQGLHPEIIVDDASHIWSQQIKALYYLLPILPSGGIFIMEDLETSFSAYRNYLYADSCVSTYEVCSWMAKIVCSREHINKTEAPAVIWELKEELEYLASQLETMCFIHGSCIMIKR